MKLTRANGTLEKELILEQIGDDEKIENSFLINVTR